MEEAPQPVPIRCVVLVADPSSEPFAGLAEAVDLERRAELHEALVGRAKEWGAQLTAAEPEVVLQTDLERCSHGTDTLVVVRPALVRLGAEHAADLKDDLDHGCGLVIGPTLSGGWYLLAVSPARSDLLEAAGSGSGGSAGTLLAAARSVSGLEAGLLRAERDLVRSPDLKAAQADPLVDPEIAKLIG